MQAVEYASDADARRRSHLHQIGVFVTVLLFHLLDFIPEFKPTLLLVL